MSATPFTSDQLLAIDISQRHLDACVVAGPGSGKTTVLVEYYRRLVAGGVDPLSILAITFTEKAAGNMRKKLAQAFQDQPETRARLERAWVSTVHGFCARLLRENAVFAGIDPEFRVLDATEAWRMQQDAMRAAIDALFAEHLEAMRGLIRGLSNYYFEPAVLNAYDTMRGAGLRAGELEDFPEPAGTARDEINDTLIAIRKEDLFGWSIAQRDQLEGAIEGAERVLSADTPLAALRAIAAFQCNLQKVKRGSTAANLLKRMREQIVNSEYQQITAFYAPQRNMLIAILRRFDALYRDRKVQGGALDFADLEEFTVRLLEESPDTRARLRRQFEHILMDEFQDTNGQQARLVELLRPPDRFYAVGDINQSIFGFRHADPAGFAEYRDDVAARGRRLVHLIDNFRSRAEILRAVETVTAGAPGIEDRSLVPGRKFADEPEFSVEVIAAPTLEMEAQWVARRILDFGQFEFQDFAILVRNTEVIPEFSAAFTAAGIPFVVNRGRGFYDSREVRDLTHLLRVIANPRDDLSLTTVLRSPLVNVSEESLLRLRMNEYSLSDALGRTTTDAYGEPDHSRLSRFAARLREYRTRREYVTFDRLLLDAIDESGYPPSPNLDKFLGQARDAATRLSLDEFVNELAILRAENPREADAPPEDSSNTVKIMTVHSAKGLEFPVVFVAAIHKGIDSSVPAVAFSRHAGLGARWRNPVTGKEKDDLFQHALRQEWKLREEQESSRLLYVAMTRAEHHLVLSFSTTNRKPENWDKLVIERLGLDPAQPGDAIMPFQTAEGLPWKARIHVVQEPPELVARTLTAEEEKPAVLFVAPPAVAAQHDGNATVTALSTFAACPRKYFLSRYLGFDSRPRQFGEFAIDEDKPRDLSAGEFGTQVHALLAGTAVPDPSPDALKLAEVFQQSALGRRAARATRSARESEFLMAMDDLVIRGQVDLWFEEAGQLVLVDYKTDDVSAAEAPHRARDYGLQLRLYALAVERMAGRAPDRAFLHFLRPNVLVEVDLMPNLIENPEQIVRDFQEAQSNLNFPLVEGPHCKSCSHYHALCDAR
ncbi:MAG: UvrD-helicase domain-containing protein [Candidatus Solibacter sp.]